MIALSYGITYIWGTVGIILICKYLPRWWGIDAKAAAKKYEEEFGVNNVEGAGLSGFRPFGLRAYRLENAATAGKTIEQFRKSNPEYRIVNVVRGRTALGADHVNRAADKATSSHSAARSKALTDKMGLIGPEVADQKALNIAARSGRNPCHQQGGRRPRARLVPRIRRSPASCRSSNYERGGVPFPVGLKTKLQRMDILTVVGLKGAVEEAGNMFGRIARPSTSTDLLTLSVGMILGFLIGAHPVPGLRRQGRPRQCRRPAGVRRDRVVARVAAAFLRQYAERGAQRPRGSRSRGLRGDRRHQRRQQPARAADRRDRAEDLPGRLHRLHDPALHRLGDRLPRLQDQSRGADGRRRRCALAFRARAAKPRSRSRARCRGSASRSPTPCPASCSRSSATSRWCWHNSENDARGAQKRRGRLLQVKRSSSTPQLLNWGRTNVLHSKSRDERSRDFPVPGHRVRHAAWPRAHPRLCAWVDRLHPSRRRHPRSARHDLVSAGAAVDPVRVLRLHHRIQVGARVLRVTQSPHAQPGHPRAYHRRRPGSPSFSSSRSRSVSTPAPPPGWRPGH